MKINCVSIGGTAIPYGNVFDDNFKYGNSKLEYLCQFLRDKNKEVNIIYFQNSDSNEDISKRLENSDVIIFLMDYLNNKKIIDISYQLKKHIHNKIIVLGRYVDFRYKNILTNNKCIDYCCLGDPYESINNLIDYFINGNEINLDHIASDNDFNKTLEKNLNIDIWPCFDYYENDIYKNNRRKIHILTLKNECCIGNCSFCWSKKEKIIYKSIDRVVKEIDLVSSKYGIRNFLFVDNDFFDVLTDDRKEQIMELLIKIQKLKKNLNFSCFARPTSIKDKHIDMYLKMKEVGFSCVFLGVDTGNNIDRKLYKKIPTLEDSIKALNILKEVNLFTRIGFISINPYSTYDTLKDNYLFLKKIKSANYYHYGGLKLMLFPGTAIYNKVYNDNLIENENNVYGYYFKNPKINEILNVVNTFINKINSYHIVDYLKLRRYYEYGVSINNKVFEKYKDLILKYEEEEYKDLISLFKILYIENNINKFSNIMDIYVGRIVCRAQNNRNIISEIKEIIYMTPISKE